MYSVKNVLTAIDDFLHEAHKLGIIKEFSLTFCDAVNNFSGTDELLFKFLNKINSTSIPSQSHQSQTECEFQKTKMSDASLTDHPEKTDLVQIQIDTNEMKRRISSFMSRKRKEVNEWNIQEFCGRSYIDEEDPSWEHQDSCARVDAVFIPRRGCKSHIKVSKVENNYGPQTQAKKIKTENENDENVLSEVIEERLQEMEYHLKLNTDSSLRANIFRRLKNLEDRILYLEGLSPEYIFLSHSDSSPKKKSIIEKDKIYSNWSIPDLNKRIETLKEFLKKK